MSEHAIWKKFNAQQMEKVKGLTSANAICSFAKTEGIKLSMKEATLLQSEIDDDMLEGINGGANAQPRRPFTR